MEDLSAKLDLIMRKVLALKAQCTKLEEENTALKAEKAQLEATLADQKNTISQLEETNKIAKIAETLSHSQVDVKATRQKINTYIREIDQCIKLLSD